MQIPTHLISSWCLGSLLFRSRGKRSLAMLAGVAADFDGIGLIAGVEYYVRYHHVLGHNFLIATVCGALCAAVSGGSWRDATAFSLVFCVHLLLDFLGSGPGWGMQIVWPFSDWYLENPWVWGLDSWQNALFLAGCILWMLIRIAKTSESPFAWVCPPLDRRFTSAVHGFVERGR